MIATLKALRTIFIFDRAMQMLFWAAVVVLASILLTALLATPQTKPLPMPPLRSNTFPSCAVVPHATAQVLYAEDGSVPSVVYKFRAEPSLKDAKDRIVWHLPSEKMASSHEFRNGALADLDDPAAASRLCSDWISAVYKAGAEATGKSTKE